MNSNVEMLLKQFTQLNSNIAKSIEKEADMQSAQTMEDFRFINNIDFYQDLNAIAFLRDIGKHFRVNSMLAKDSVKSRMATADSGEGISFTEFSYQVLQAHDFYRLFQDHNCRVQVGGSDQWGNITAGCDFIRRKTHKEAFGMTIPLLVDARGEKFGKSTGGGALWLDADRTSAYQLYQYLLNVQDSEVEDLLYRQTFKSEAAITEIMAEHMDSPEK